MIKRETKGITLIALVVTIVVLLILAGITISLVFSENGIIAKAREAAEKTNQASINEQEDMNKVTDYMSNLVNGTGGGSIGEEPGLPSDGSYSELKGVNTPKLGEGMTPIKWNGSAWEETTGDDEEWYDYSSKKWANAVVGGSFNEDGTLNQSSNYSMFVWIPRYAYSITSGYHQSGADLNSTTPEEGAGTIEVEFMKGTSNESATGRTTFQNVSGQGNWNIHPAFEYGETVSGIWVAKFEASSVEGNSNSTEGDNVTTKTLQVKPGVASWRWINISNMYDVCLSYNSTLNSHLMKNDEWGAVAYLSKSKYGKETEEVWINNSSSFITGSAGNSASASSDIGTDNDYASAQGVKASTTGTVYGVYDMSGGSWEYVAAYVNNGNDNLTIYGSSLVNGDAKAKNVYTMGSGDTKQANYNANASKYGDAVYETSSEYETSGSSWHADYSSFPSLSGPFFRRGGGYSNTTSAGMFFFNENTGYNGGNASFRPVLVIL